MFLFPNVLALCNSSILGTCSFYNSSSVKYFKHQLERESLEFNKHLGAKSNLNGISEFQKTYKICDLLKFGERVSYQVLL